MQTISCVLILSCYYGTFGQVAELKLLVMNP